jgi:hypothetical protein
MISCSFIRNMICVALCGAAVCLLFVGPAMSAELLSIQGLQLEDTDFIWGFDIKMDHGRILAICNVPAGWTLNIQNHPETAMDKEGGAQITGESSLGHDAITMASRGELTALVLVDTSFLGAYSVSFAGTLTVISYSGTNDGKIELRPTNFTMHAAKGCPSSN